MKRLGVAAYITKYNGALLLGRRGKDPNRGLYVLPGGGVKEGETLEQALGREIAEETGYQIAHDPNRWEKAHLIELDDRIVLVVKAHVYNQDNEPKSGSDLYDVEWFYWHNMPFKEISPVVQTVIVNVKKDEALTTYSDPYDPRYPPSSW